MGLLQSAVTVETNFQMFVKTKSVSHQFVLSLKVLMKQIIQLTYHSNKKRQHEKYTIYIYIQIYRLGRFRMHDFYLHFYSVYLYFCCSETSVNQ